MSSRYAQIKKESTVGSMNVTRLCDFEETDPYYIIVKENGKILSEGSITKIKFLLSEEILHRKIKSFIRNPDIMLMTVEV